MRKDSIFLATGIAVTMLTALPVSAVTDWRADGRLGYESWDKAEEKARAFTERGAPFDGKSYIIVRDPDGGYTPVFSKLPPELALGS